MLNWYRMFLDKLVVTNTASDSFEDWLNGNLRYNPTVLCNLKPNLLPMAMAFDKAQRSSGNPRRVWPPLPETLRELRLFVLVKALVLLDDLEQNIDEYSAEHVMYTLNSIDSQLKAYSHVTKQKGASR